MTSDIIMDHDIMNDEAINNRIGIVGLGNLGFAMAKNLIQSGFEVLGYRRTSISEFVEIGGVAAGSPAEIASRCKIIITCLPSVEALHEVVSGEKGLLKTISAGTILLEMSTLLIAAKTEVARQLEQAGCMALDCPVSGSADMILLRQGMVFASGHEAAYKNVSCVFDGIIDGHSYVGEFSVGMATKLCANLIVAVNNAVVAEAMCFARKAGLDAETVVQLLKNSGAGSRQFDTRAPKMAQENYMPANGTVHSIAEVVKLISSRAEEVDCDTPFLSRAMQWYQKAIDEGRGEQDMAVLHTVMLDTMS